MLRTSLFLCLLTASAAFAQEEVAASAPEPAPESAFEVTLKAGLHLPQIANPLQTSFDGVLKVGYGLPFWQRRLQTFVDFAYTQPAVTVTGLDGRIAGGTFTSTTVLRDFGISLGLAFSILEPSGPLVPYVSAAVRLHLLLAETSGQAGGASFGKWEETDTRFGAAFAAGAGYRLGPGRVLAELAFNILPVEQRLTGSSNASSMSVLIGYGLFF